CRRPSPRRAFWRSISAICRKTNASWTEAAARWSPQHVALPGVSGGVAQPVAFPDLSSRGQGRPKAGGAIGTGAVAGESLVFRQGFMASRSWLPEGPVAILGGSKPRRKDDSCLTF